MKRKTFFTIEHKTCFKFVQINHMSKENKVRGHELEVKGQECEQLEKDILEAQSMLQQSTSRIHELEELQAQLQEQVLYCFLLLFFFFCDI